MMIHCTNSQFGFMPVMSTTYAIFTPKQTSEKHREGQTNIRVTFLDLEKAAALVWRSDFIEARS